MARFDTRRTNQDGDAHGWLTRSYSRSGGKWILAASLLCFAGNSGAQIGATAPAVSNEQAAPPPAATTAAPSTSAPVPDFELNDAFATSAEQLRSIMEHLLHREQRA